MSRSGNRSLFWSFVVMMICAVSGEKCVPQSACLCKYDDGRVIDLNPLKGEPMIATKANLTYYFHPCANMNLTKIPNLPPNTTNPCEKGTSLCLVNTTDKVVITNLGKNEDAHMAPSALADNLYEMVFVRTNTTIVSLACSNFPENMLAVEDTVPKKCDLVLMSLHACPRIGKTGFSTGSVLIIILWIVSFVYLVGGACVLYFLRGARGKEMIPNIDFWTELPLLVRDGAVFLQNGCKPPQQPGETYDRI